MAKNRFFIYRSLQAQLILAVGLCLIVVGGVIIGYAGWISYTSAVENARQNAIKEAKFQAREIAVK